MANTHEIQARIVKLAELKIRELSENKPGKQINSEEDLDIFFKED